MIDTKETEEIEKAKERQGYLRPESYRVIEFLGRRCYEEIGGAIGYISNPEDEPVRELYRRRARFLNEIVRLGGTDKTDEGVEEFCDLHAEQDSAALRAAIDEEVERRFLLHVIQLFIHPSCWDFKQASRAQEAEVLATRDDEVKALFDEGLRIHKARYKKHYQKVVAKIMESDD
jgi:hypothetical protein